VECTFTYLNAVGEDSRCQTRINHAHCILCGSINWGTILNPMCAHHSAGYDDTWHLGNKIMCDFLHRGMVPKRLPESERSEDPYEGVY